MVQPDLSRKRKNASYLLCQPLASGLRRES